MPGARGSAAAARCLRYGALLVCLVALGRPGSLAAQVYEVEGLRLTMTLAEARLVHPDLTVEEIPYEDDRVGTDYQFITGRPEPLRYEGRFLVERGPQAGAQVEVVFTGRPELYAIQAQVLDTKVDCLGAIDRLVGLYGRPVLDDRPAYASWRQVVVLGPQLELSCLDDRQGLYRLTLRQPFLQELYLQDLLRRLQPAIEATLQFIR